MAVAPDLFESPEFQVLPIVTRQGPDIEPLPPVTGGVDAVIGQGLKGETGRIFLDAADPGARPAEGIGFRDDARQVGLVARLGVVEGLTPEDQLHPEGR